MTPDVDLLEELARHVEECELGVRICGDCRTARDVDTQSAITRARSEHELHRVWLQRHPGVCIYCGESADHRDHLVPINWTGPIARMFVPMVPACGDCNRRINDALVQTIAGRSEVVASSLRRKYGKQLSIPDRDEDWFAEFNPRMAANLRAAQGNRRLLRLRLAVLDMGGAVNDPAIEMAA